MKLPEKNRGRKLFDINPSNIFLDRPPRRTKMNTKLNKQDRIKLKSFCIAKEIITQKDNPQNGRIHLQAMRLINLQNIQIAFAAQLKKKITTMTTIKKQAADLNRHFSKEDIQMAKRHTKRYTTSLIQRNANQNYNEVWRVLKNTKNRFAI